MIVIDSVGQKSDSSQLWKGNPECCFFTSKNETNKSVDLEATGVTVPYVMDKSGKKMTGSDVSWKRQKKCTSTPCRWFIKIAASAAEMEHTERLDHTNRKTPSKPVEIKIFSSRCIRKSSESSEIEVWDRVQPFRWMTNRVFCTRLGLVLHFFSVPPPLYPSFIRSDAVDRRNTRSFFLHFFFAFLFFSFFNLFLGRHSTALNANANRQNPLDKRRTRPGPTMMNERPCPSPQSHRADESLNRWFFSLSLSLPFTFIFVLQATVLLHLCYPIVASFDTSSVPTPPWPHFRTFRDSLDFYLVYQIDFLNIYTHSIFMSRYRQWLLLSEPSSLLFTDEIFFTKFHEVLDIHRSFFSTVMALINTTKFILIYRLCKSFWWLRR